MNVLIAMPQYNGELANHTRIAIQKLINSGIANFEWKKCDGSSDIARSRNYLIKYFLEKSDADRILFVDTDISADLESFKTIILTDEPIISGSYNVYGKPEKICAGIWRDDIIGVESHDAIKPNNGTIEVDWFGAGLLSIHRDVFKNLKKPYFCREYIEIPGIDRTQCSEDIGLCINAKNAGYKLMLDTNTNSRHYKEKDNPEKNVLKHIENMDKLILEFYKNKSSIENHIKNIENLLNVAAETSKTLGKKANGFNN